MGKMSKLTYTEPVIEFDYSVFESDGIISDDDGWKPWGDYDTDESSNNTETGTMYSEETGEYSSNIDDEFATLTPATAWINPDYSS